MFKKEECEKLLEKLRSCSECKNFLVVSSNKVALTEIDQMHFYGVKTLLVSRNFISEEDKVYIIPNRNNKEPAYVLSYDYEE